MATEYTSPPSGTVTFLFTDIVGSTDAWERHGDAYLPVLQAHNAIIADAVARNGGFVMKTEGDCYKIAFSDAAAAVRCAVVIQASLNRYPWPADVGALTVRMAVHTGQPFVHCDDYFGPPVNRTARILSAAHGGQIVMSGDALEAQSQADPSVRFEDLGFHRLRDLGEPVRLYRVEHPALGAAVNAAPRSLNEHANNLPTQRSSFVGREKEIEKIASLLSHPDTKLVMLTGPGGIGKTRLSLQVAAERMELFPHGAWYVRLESARDVTEAAAEVAHEIGIHVPTGADPLATVRDWLAGRQCLLILDDFGHVPQADKLIRELLTGSTSLRCLATSRESVQVEEGSELLLPELTLPSESGGAQELLASEGGRLFVERASEANAEFELTERRAPVISRILNVTGGIPAVIEKTAELAPKQRLGALLQAVSGEVKQGARQAAGLLKRVKETPEFAAVLQEIGSVAADRHDLARAEQMARRSLELYQRMGDREGIALSLWQLGTVARQQKDHRRAVMLLSAALNAAHEANSAEVERISVDLAMARRALGELGPIAAVSLDQAVAAAMAD